MRSASRKISFSQERHAEHGAVRSALYGFGHGVFWIGQNVGDVNDLPLQYGSPRQRSSSDLNGMLFQVLLEFSRVDVISNYKTKLTVAPPKQSVVRLT